MPVTLQIGDTVKLPSTLEPNKVATIKSETLNITPGANWDETSVSLLNTNGDILLVFAIRRQGNVIVLNSKTSGGPWGDEVSRDDLEHIFGPSLDTATISIKDIGDAYQIFTNGNYLATYEKRIPGEAQQASYTLLNDEESALANPIQISVN